MQVLCIYGVSRLNLLWFVIIYDHGFFSGYLYLSLSLFGSMKDSNPSLHNQFTGVFHDCS